MFLQGGNLVGLHVWFRRVAIVRRVVRGILFLFVGLLFVVVGVLGLTLVLDVSDVAGIAIDVIIDNLTATVGQVNVVVSVSVVSLAALLGSKVDVKIVVIYVIFVFVVDGSLNKQSKTIRNLIIQEFHSWKSRHNLRIPWRRSLPKIVERDELMKVPGKNKRKRHTLL